MYLTLKAVYVKRPPAPPAKPPAAGPTFGPHRWPVGPLVFLCLDHLTQPF